MDDNNPRLSVLQLHLPIPNVMFCLHRSLSSTALLVSSLLQHRRCFASISISVISIQVRNPLFHARSLISMSLLSLTVNLG